MKKTFKDYVFETLQAIVVGGSLTGLSYLMYKSFMKKVFDLGD